MLKNMKITAKLAISSAAFLAPIAVMLYLVVSVSGSSIQTARNEQRGIACLKPIAGILQAIPKHSLEYKLGDSAGLNNEILSMFNKLEEELENSRHLFDSGRSGGRKKINAGSDAARREDDNVTVLVSAIRNSLDNVNTGGFEKTLESYTNIIMNIRELITYIGDSSGLVSDADLDNYFFVNISIKSLPQAQLRFMRLGNAVRLASLRNSFSETIRSDLVASLTLLREVDYPESIYNLQSAGWKNGDVLTGDETPEAEGILSDLEKYRLSLEAVMTVLEAAAADPDPSRYYPIIFERLDSLNADTFLLWDAAVTRLDNLLNDRINDLLVSLIRSLAIAVLASVFAFVIIIMTNISISRSTTQLDQLFKSLHDDDLSLTLKVESMDEFGKMMSEFNQFLEKLRTAFASFSQTASIVSSSVFDLSASAKEISTTANEQSTSVAEIVSTMENSKNLSQQVSAETSEVANLMVKTQELSRRGAELREVNQDMMQDIRDQNAKIVEEIMNLAEMINHIDEVISIIDVIADQTKLMAFNASLEASSSGEEGARFAVVAGEIRRFADSVAESTAEIKEKIEEIQSASHTLINEANEGSQQIDDGYERLVEQKTVFENIVEVSQDTAARSQQISNLSKQQELMSSQIFQALKEISAGVKQFVVATTSTAKIADNLNAMSIDLRETVEKYRTGKISETETGEKPNGN
jgi:methyl-accepting chemotaxis protein